MIQIIAGAFGYYNGRKVVPITNADGPQKFDPELEARLVKKGVAKYVDEKPVSLQQDHSDDRCRCRRCAYQYSSADFHLSVYAGADQAGTCISGEAASV